MCFPSLQAKIPNNSARHAGSCCFQNCWQSSLFPCTLPGFPPAEVLCSEIQPSWWFLESVVPICCERSSINALSCLMSQPREAEHYLFGGSWWKHRVLRDLEWKHRLFIQFLWNSYFSRRNPYLFVETRKKMMGYLKIPVFLDRTRLFFRNIVCLDWVALFSSFRFSRKWLHSILSKRHSASVAKK